MKTKSLLSAILLIFVGFNIMASKYELKKTIYSAYIDGNIKKWEQLNYVYSTLSFKSLGKHEREELLGLHYGLIAYYLGTGNKNKASVQLNIATQYIQELIKMQPNNARLQAMQGAMLGFAIGLNPLKAPFIGFKSLSYIEKAIEVDSESPYAWLEKANSLYYAPEFAGGSKLLALDAYKKSILLFEKQNLASNNWVYLNALTSLARAYEELDQNQSALRLYNNILLIEPNFLWVKDELLPNLKNKIR